MTCHEFMEIALQREELDQEALAHLASCQECREFYETLSTLAARNSAPSEALDRRCLQAVGEQLMTRKRLLYIRRTILAMAACIAVCLGVQICLRGNDGTPAGGTEYASGDEILDAMVATDSVIENLELEMLLVGTFY